MLPSELTAVVEVEEQDKEVTVIHVCAGPPQCALEGDDAVAAQIAGCVWCRRITIDNGHESEEGPAHA